MSRRPEFDTSAKEYRQPCGEEFEPEFEHALKQAAALSLISLAGLGEGNTPRSMLILARVAWINAPEGHVCSVDGLKRGVEIVAYDCDEHGRVANETRRFRMKGIDCQSAVDRLRFQLANGLATLEAPDAEETYLPDLIGNERTYHDEDGEDADFPSTNSIFR